MNTIIILIHIIAIIATAYLYISYLAKSYNEKVLQKTIDRHFTKSFKEINIPFTLIHTPLSIRVELKTKEPEQPAICIPEDSKNKLIDNLFCKNKCVRKWYRPVVIVVESNDKVRNYLLSCLSKDYTVIGVNEGNEALAAIDEEHPDLVICNMELSGMSGVELSSRLKTSYKTGGIPIILLCPHKEKDKHYERKASLADIFKYNPYNIEEIKADIAVLIANNRTLQQSLLQNLFGENFIHMDADKVLKTQNLQFIYKVKNYTLEHLAENVTRKKIASYLCMSSSGFYQKWVSITGEAPSLFIERIKMLKAMEFIKSELYKIDEIPLLIGLSDVTYFRKRFKENFGMTPTEAIRRYHTKVDVQTIEI